MLIIGSRGSALALSQTGWVRERIISQLPPGSPPLPPIKVIKTSADKDTKTSIRAGANVGVFVRELEEALLSGEIDLAVHSMKDLPGRIREGLEITAIPVREDARDALVTTTKATSIQELPPAAIVGTGSIRRQAQLLGMRPDLRVLDTRGNVDTRLKKMEGGGYDALILACAGLNRLGLAGRISAKLDPSEMLPAPGQGALALEMRRGDKRAPFVRAAIHDRTAALEVMAERSFLRRAGGGCNSPVAAQASFDGIRLKIEGLIASPDGSNLIRESTTSEAENGEEAAAQLAEKVLSLGGREILRSLRV
jgi:hydroxymethylbilane synthase